MPPDQPSEDEDPEYLEETEEVSSRGRRSSRRRGEARSHFTPEQRPRWEAWLLALIPLLICFLGGGRSVFARGIAATCVGLLIVVAPPRYRLPRILIAALVALLCAPLIGFLPMHLLGPQPEWRTLLVENWGLVLPGSVTAETWVTFEAWLLLICGITWLAWCASRGTTLADRRVVIRALVGGLCLIAVLALMDRAKMIHILWWKFPPELGLTFGPFANRNHTSSLMAMAGVLCAAVAHDHYRNKQRSWMIYLPMLVPFFLVIITNTSRAGVLLLFFGTTIWMWTSAMRKSFFKKVALASSLLLTGVSIVIVFGTSLASRLVAGLGKGTFNASEGVRLSLYSDVIKMTSAAPWSGTGLGTFSDVFPQVASFHEPRCRFLHPESDWLWLMAEGGMLAVIALAAVTILFASMCGPWSGSKGEESSSRQDRRLRQAAAIAAFMSALHGIVDVPNHNLGFNLVSSVLLALAVRPSRVRLQATWIDAVTFRILGFCVLASGVSWLAISMGTPAVPGASSARLLSQKARTLSALDRDGEALQLAERAIEMNPLNWTLYFLRAQLHLRLKHADQLAMLDFGRARAIEPHYGKMCIEEGEVWLAHRSRFAIQAWKEFLRRQPERTDYYNMLLHWVQNDPDIKREARKIATTAPLKLIYLRSVYQPDEFRDVLNDLIKQQPSLAGLEPEGRLEIFRLWQQRGDREALKAALQKNLAWQQDAWPVLCEELAKEGNYEAAYRLAIHYELPPISPSVSGLQELGQLEQNFLFNPTDPRRGLDLYFAQKSRMQWSAALATLEKVAGLPSVPSYVMYEMASVYAQKQDFRKAWELISKYLIERK